MHKNKFLLILILIITMAPCVFAGGVNVFLAQGAIQNKDGGNIELDGQGQNQYHPYPTKPQLEFYYNSLPVANIKGNPILGPDQLGGSYSLDGNEHKYMYPSYDGGTFYIRVWNGAPETYDSWYGYSSHGVAAAVNLPQDWHISSLKAQYHAKEPPAPNVLPGIPSYDEIMVQGEPQLVPKVAITVSNSNTENYEISGYKIEIYKATVNDQGQITLGALVASKDIITTNSSASWTTDPNANPLEFGTTYAVKANAKNCWGSGLFSEPKIFKTIDLGQVGAALVSDVNITLTKVDLGQLDQATGFPYSTLKLSWKCDGKVDIHAAADVNFSQPTKIYNGIAANNQNIIVYGTTYFKVVPEGSLPALSSDLTGIYGHKFTFDNYGINVYNLPFSQIEGLNDGVITDFDRLYKWVIGPNSINQKTVSMMGSWKNPKTSVGYTIDNQGVATKINNDTPSTMQEVLLNVNVPVQISVRPQAAGKYFVVVGKR